MDNHFGQAGFTIPAEVNVRLLPPQRNRSVARDRPPAPRISSLSDSPAQSSVARAGPDQRGPDRRHLSTMSSRAPWATPLVSEARSNNSDAPCQSSQPPSTRLRDRVDDARRDSGTGACFPSQRPFTQSPERRQGDTSEDYNDYGGAATVMRERQYAQSNTTPYAAARRKKLVTDQAEYDIIKHLRPATHNRRQEELYLVEDCDTKELFVQKRWSMSSPSSRERATAERDALWQILKQDAASAHITEIIEAFCQSGDAHSHLILEYCDSGTIEDFIHRYQREDKSTPEDFAWHMLASLASALCTCHYGVGHDGAIGAAPRDGKMLCHLNIRPGNVWLTSQQQVGPYPRVMLGGFDLVATKEDIASGKARGFVARYGKQEWMPPEGRFQRDDIDRSRAHLKLGSATDIWQIGAVVQGLCCLIEVPRVEGTDVDQSVCGRDFSFALNNVVACCMQPDWRDRPNAVDLTKEVHRETLQRAQSKRAEGSGYSVA